VTNSIPRLRMFAGPNGSGKSTLKRYLPEKLLGVYLNPDDIEQEIRRLGFLDLSSYGVFVQWKAAINEESETASGELLDRPLAEMCDKTRLLDLIRNFIIFDAGQKRFLDRINTQASRPLRNELPNAKAV